jgi:diguanylate cyclase (GGDEF)-like protein
VQQTEPVKDVLPSTTPDLRDPLTGLPTHLILRDRLEHALARAHRHERPVAVMLLDIDGFRGINDAFGYAAGDLVLAAVASRLNSTLRGGDTASRLGADEFGLLLEDMSDESNFVQVSERISEALARPIAIDQRELTISACTGIAQATPDDDADTLMRNVDAALAAAKRRGRGACEVFSDRIRAALVDRVELEAELRTAVEAHAFLDYVTDAASSRVRRSRSIAALASRVAEKLAVDVFARRRAGALSRPRRCLSRPAHR